MWSPTHVQVLGKSIIVEVACKGFLKLIIRLIYDVQYQVDIQ